MMVYHQRLTPQYNKPPSQRTFRDMVIRDAKGLVGRWVRWPGAPGGKTWKNVVQRMSVEADGSQFATGVFLDTGAFEIEADDPDGLIEVQGDLYCGACGMLEQPGDESFDWCDHIRGNHCPYFKDGDDSYE